MKRSIKKIAVLGSGVMGSRIACHFAGIGVQVLLLDMVPKIAEESTKPAERNKLVNDALIAAIKSNPSPVFTKDVIKRITTGNFDDNMKDIANCDWIIELWLSVWILNNWFIQKWNNFENREPWLVPTLRASPFI